MEEGLEGIHGDGGQRMHTAKESLSTQAKVSVYHHQWVSSAKKGSAAGLWSHLEPDRLLKKFFNHFQV